MTTIVGERGAGMRAPSQSAIAAERPTGQERLSGALRRGARVHPQGQGALYRNGQTCALGAVLVGLVGPEPVEQRAVDYERMKALVQQQTGVDMEQYVCLPSYSRMETRLWSAITFLNDRDGWTRERIAAWLETLGL